MGGEGSRSVGRGSRVANVVHDGPSDTPVGDGGHDAKWRAAAGTQHGIESEGARQQGAPVDGSGCRDEGAVGEAIPMREGQDVPLGGLGLAGDVGKDALEIRPASSYDPCDRGEGTSLDR